jgi:hypothetical protein
MWRAAGLVEEGDEDVRVKLAQLEVRSVEDVPVGGVDDDDWLADLAAAEDDLMLGDRLASARSAAWPGTPRRRWWRR